MMLTIFILMQITFFGITKIYETFLYISDQKISEIGNYLVLSNSFFERQFQVNEKSTKAVFANVELSGTEKKKECSLRWWSELSCNLCKTVSFFFITMLSRSHHKIRLIDQIVN